MSAIDSEYLTVAVADGVGRVVMDRPDSHNSMNPEMAADVRDALEALAGDDGVRCLALTGVGGVFNTGADLSLMDGDEGDAETIEAIATPLHGAVRAMVEADQPVVTGVNGVVAGGGIGLALGGDVVVMSDEARFEYAYPKIGLSGDGGSTWFLPRLLGLRRAQEFALLDEPIGPEEAEAEGLVTRVVPDDSLDDRLGEIAGRLADGPTLAYAEIKDLLRKGGRRSLDEQLADEKARITSLPETADYAAGIEAFFEKESPAFEGR